mgnify:CR=1 FL=1
MHTLHSDQLVTMATPIRADVATLQGALNAILERNGKVGGGGGGGGGGSKDQVEQLCAVIAKDGERKIAELNAKWNDYADKSEIHVHKLDNQITTQAASIAKWKAGQQRSKQQVTKLMAQIRALKAGHDHGRNAALEKLHNADVQLAALKKQIQTLNIKVAHDFGLLHRQARDHSGNLKAWTKAISADANKASQDLINGKITDGTKRYEAIFKNIEDTEEKVHEIRAVIKQSADGTIEAQRKVAEDDHTIAANALEALKEKGEEDMKEAKAAESKLQESKRTLEHVKVFNSFKLVDDHSIKMHEEEIKKQEEALLKAQPAALYDSFRVNAGIAELKKKKEDLTALQTRFKELGLPAAPEAPKAPAPDSGSSWTRSRLVGAAGLVGATVGTGVLATKYGPSMVSYLSGNSSTAGGGGASVTNGIEFKPRGSKANGNYNNRNGDNGRWPEPEL